MVFRTPDRDIWRGAFLPARVVETLDEWLEPCLAARAEMTGAQQAIDVEVDWRAFALLTAGLNRAHRKWGGVILYSDPADDQHACRHSFREAMMKELHQQPWIFRFISGLSAAQWERLRGEGLRVGVDMSREAIVELWRYEPGWSLPAHLVLSSSTDLDSRPGGWMSFEDGDVVRMQRGAEAGDATPPEWRIFVERASDVGEWLDSFELPVTIAITPPASDSIPASTARRPS
jgi:hypothetical protein